MHERRARAQKPRTRADSGWGRATTDKDHVGSCPRRDAAAPPERACCCCAVVGACRSGVLARARDERSSHGLYILCPDVMPVRRRLPTHGVSPKCLLPAVSPQARSRSSVCTDTNRHSALSHMSSDLPLTLSPIMRFGPDPAAPHHLPVRMVIWRHMHAWIWTEHGRHLT